MPLRRLFLLAVLAAAAAADPGSAAAKKAAALKQCQAACNALDTKSGAYPQMKVHCGTTYPSKAAKTAKGSCLKGFKLGLSIGCDFVCEAGGAPKAGTSSGAALLASVRAARDAACAGTGEGTATEACR